MFVPSKRNFHSSWTVRRGKILEIGVDGLNNFDKGMAYTCSPCESIGSASGDIVRRWSHLLRVLWVLLEIGEDLTHHRISKDHLNLRVGHRVCSSFRIGLPRTLRTRHSSLHISVQVRTQFFMQRGNTNGIATTCCTKEHDCCRDRGVKKAPATSLQLQHASPLMLASSSLCGWTRGGHCRMIPAVPTSLIFIVVLRTPSVQSELFGSTVNPCIDEFTSVGCTCSIERRPSR